MGGPMSLGSLTLERIEVVLIYLWVVYYKSKLLQKPDPDFWVVSSSLCFIPTMWHCPPLDPYQSWVDAGPIPMSLNNHELNIPTFFLYKAGCLRNFITVSEDEYYVASYPKIIY
jgi:hypothetical protein